MNNKFIGGAIPGNLTMTLVPIPAMHVNHAHSYQCLTPTKTNNPWCTTCALGLEDSDIVYCVCQSRKDIHRGNKQFVGGQAFCIEYADPNHPQILTCTSLHESMCLHSLIQYMRLPDGSMHKPNFTPETTVSMMTE
jgi:hypothetical protein